MSDRKRVFVFDDDAAFRSLLVEILELRGYEAVGFERAFLCETCSCPPDRACADFAISDVSMPMLSGVEFSEHLRMANCRVENIALMSGNWSSADLERAEELGCRVFHKPFAIEELLAWLVECEQTIDPGRRLTDAYPTATGPSRPAQP